MKIAMKLHSDIDLIYDIENSAPGYLDIKKPKIIENKNPQIK